MEKGGRIEKNGYGLKEKRRELEWQRETEKENNKTEFLVISRAYISLKLFWINHTYTWYSLSLVNKE